MNSGLDEEEGNPVDEKGCLENVFCKFIWILSPFGRDRS
jgi:hypothetical protein